jgi:flagellar biogenesis protein FliO
VRNHPQNFHIARGRGVTLLSLLWLLLTSHCLAQTTAPALPRPIAPAPIEGAYEHDALHKPAGVSILTTDGKQNIAVQSPASGPLDIRRVAIALGIVLGLVFICRWAARWMFPSVVAGRSSQVMKVLSRTVIAPKQQLLLIQVGRRLVLVGDCGQQMSALAEITEPDEVASLLGQLRADPPVTQSANPFAPLLGRAQQRFEDLPVPPIDESEDGAELAIAGVDQTRGELSGLTEKIRLLSRQLGKT